MIMSHDEMIAVIQAHIVGRAVQFKLKAYPFGGLCGWRDLTVQGHPFNFAEADYRIKPEPPKPREWDMSPESLDAAQLIDNIMGAGGKNPKIHVREVLPDVAPSQNRIIAGGNINQGDPICIIGNTAYAYTARRDGKDDKPWVAVPPVS